MVKKLRLSWTRASGTLPNWRFVNSALSWERQKGDMQGPLGQLDSHQNEIIVLRFILLQLKTFHKNRRKSRKVWRSIYWTSNCTLVMGGPQSCMKLSRLIGSGMLQPFNSDMKWWQGLNIQVTRTWVARIRSMRTAPRMPKLQCCCRWHWHCTGQQVWGSLWAGAQGWLGQPRLPRANQAWGRRAGRKTRQASTPRCYLTCYTHLLKLCPIPTIFILFFICRRLSKCSHKKLPELMTRAFLNTLPPILTSVCAACQIDFKAQLHLNVFRLSSCIEVDGLAWEVLSVQTPTSNTHTHNLLFPMSMSQCPLPNSQCLILNSQCPMTKSQCQIPKNQFPMTSPHW